MKPKNEQFKRRIELLVIAALIVAFAVTVVINVLTNRPTVSLNVQEAQEIVDQTLQNIAEPTAQTAASVVEAANVTVQDVVKGTEKDFTVHCTFDAADVASVYRANKDRIFSDTYAYTLHEKEAGNMVNATKIRLKMDQEIKALLDRETPGKGEIDLHVYEIGAAAAENDTMAIPYGESFLRVYLDDGTVNTLFGGLVDVANDIKATSTVSYEGETVDITNNSTLRTGIGDCFALRNFNTDKPDTSAYFVAKWNSLCDEFKRNFIDGARWSYLTNGLLTTLEITLFFGAARYLPRLPLRHHPRHLR